MKSALIRWHKARKGTSPVAKIDNVLEIGEGQNFIHIFTTNPAMPEVNIRSILVDLITLVDDVVDEPAPQILDESGAPITSEDTDEDDAA